MRSLKPLAVFVVAILTLQVRSTAVEPQVAPENLQQVSATATSQPYSANGFDQYRRSADLGGPNSAGYGFKHFSLPFQNYTLWHRPKAATLTKYQRCAPDSFRPRGLGHLFAEPCDSFRMDYNPYSITEATSQYGPSYILRREDQRCDECAK
ncbi:MAG: hypothetical protein WAO83_06155 [Fuerstiella sp.]